MQTAATAAAAVKPTTPLAIDSTTSLPLLIKLVLLHLGNNDSRLLSICASDFVLNNEFRGTNTLHFLGVWYFEDTEVGFGSLFEIGEKWTGLRSNFGRSASICTSVSWGNFVWREKGEEWRKSGEFWRLLLSDLECVELLEKMLWLVGICLRPPLESSVFSGCGVGCVPCRSVLSGVMWNLK